MPKAFEETERTRGRPRDAGKDDAIRAATWEVLAREGYGGLTFEAVAEAAGCTRATLYRRFSSKMELIGAVFHETSRKVEPALLMDLPPREALTALVRSTIEFMSGEHGHAILSFAAAAVRLPQLRAGTAGYFLNEFRLHASIFVRLAPGVSDERMAFAFDTFVGIMLSHVVLAERVLDSQGIDLIVDLMIELLKRE